MKKSILILALIVASLASTQSAFAEISNPYIVDEKPQVNFGDSFAIDGYYGLENYTQDYMGGYAHVTFTYTHFTTNQECCNANYPPRLYITNTDPRATTTPVVRSMAVVYHLTQRTHNPEHTSNWYLYDIQFDATGYTLVVTRGGDTEIVNEHRDIAGLTDDDWVALANTHPMNPPTSPPTPDSMSFTPFPLKEGISTGGKLRKLCLWI